MTAVVSLARGCAPTSAPRQGIQWRIGTSGTAGCCAPRRDARPSLLPRSGFINPREGPPSSVGLLEAPLHLCRGSASFGPDGVGKVSFSGKDESASRTSRIASFIRRGKEHYGWDRKKLASLGASVMLSYGFISNVNACTLVTIAWVTCGRTTGLSPLAAGNWTAFLGIYGALYLSFGNLLRPIRASIAVAISPLFEKFVNFLQAKFKVRRPVAFGITVFLINVLGSLSYFALAISTACFVCKVPLLP